MNSDGAIRREKKELKERTGFPPAVIAATPAAPVTVPRSGALPGIAPSSAHDHRIVPNIATREVR